MFFLYSAALVMGEGGEGRPLVLVLVRGFAPFPHSNQAAVLVRDPSHDLFR